MGVASALAVVHFRFLGLVDVREVASCFPIGVDLDDLAFLMPRLEDAADTVLAIVPLDNILHGPSPNH